MSLPRSPAHVPPPQYFSKHVNIRASQQKAEREGRSGRERRRSRSASPTTRRRTTTGGVAEKVSPTLPAASDAVVAAARATGAVGDERERDSLASSLVLMEEFSVSASARASPTMAARLDVQFLEALQEIEQSSKALARGLRVRVHKWVEKLSISGTSNTTLKKHRNAYAKLLLDMVVMQHMQFPFDRNPPEGELPSFPTQLRARLREAMTPKETAFWRSVNTRVVTTLASEQSRHRQRADQERQQQGQLQAQKHHIKPNRVRQAREDAAAAERAAVAEKTRRMDARGEADTATMSMTMTMSEADAEGADAEEEEERVAAQRASEAKGNRRLSGHDDSPFLSSPSFPLSYYRGPNAGGGLPQPPGSGDRMHAVQERNAAAIRFGGPDGVNSSAIPFDTLATPMPHSSAESTHSAHTMAEPHFDLSATVQIEDLRTVIRDQRIKIQSLEAQLAEERDHHSTELARIQRLHALELDNLNTFHRFEMQRRGGTPLAASPPEAANAAAAFAGASAAAAAPSSAPAPGRGQLFTTSATTPTAHLTQLGADDSHGHSPSPEPEPHQQEPEPQPQPQPRHGRRGPQVQDGDVLAMHPVEHAGEAGAMRAEQGMRVGEEGEQEPNYDGHGHDDDGDNDRPHNDKYHHDQHRDNHGEDGVREELWPRAGRGGMGAHDANIAGEEGDTDIGSPIGPAPDTVPHHHHQNWTHSGARSDEVEDVPWYAT